MCTAISHSAGTHYFGRTLDYEVNFGEQVTVTPRNYSFAFRHVTITDPHYAMIGMAKVVDGYPLYFDAVNEKGLAMAGLNFPGFADYKAFDRNKTNVAPFELIPWVLSRCERVKDARPLLMDLSLVDTSFRADLPLSPLHWMLADDRESLVIESVKEGLRIHENTVDVMTNSPPFDHQLLHLSQFSNLSNCQPRAPIAPLYSRGMGAIGLPGDYSSGSRFVRAAFLKKHAMTDTQTVTEFFHLLDAVSVPKGAVLLEDGQPVITQYACCMDTEKGIYHYTTHSNRQITAVDLHKTDLDGEEVTVYPVEITPQIHVQND